MTATQADTVAELQRTIAELRRERDAALAREAALAEALATRNSEYGERIDQQAATIDVLKAMSASPGDPQPVFDLIVDRARDLCDAYGATVFEFDGTGIHWRAATGVSDDPAVRAAYEAQFPMVPTRGWAFGRAILDRRIIRIDDMEAEPGLDPTLRGITAKSNVTTPIMRGDEVIGAIGMGSREKGGFSDSQVELLKTFAEQAAIAITSAETYRALQTRTSDLQETLEYQTATSDVLKVISRSAFDLQPVLDAVVETAARLCTAEFGHLALRDGDVYRPFACFAFSPEFEQFVRQTTFTPGRGSCVGRVLLEARLVQINDITTDPEYALPQVASLGNVRSILGVPLLREGTPIGVFALCRQRVEPFTDRQIELVSTFADQAVIAIENTRLITEQREALEQQTATTEVLQVINSSPGNLVPVFDTMLESAMRLCEASFGELYSYEDAVFHPLAFAGVPPAYAAYKQERGDRHTKPDPGSMAAQIVAGERVVHIGDLKDTDDYRSGSLNRRAMVDLGGARSAISVALRKDGELRGGVVIYRQEVRSFSEKQIALVENFAAQAVIAMDNAQLLTEQQEALEQQTATAEVLGVINSSPGNLTPVFEAMLDKAMRLCNAAFGSLYVLDGEHLRSVAQRGVPAYANYRAAVPPSSTGGIVAELIRGKRPIHVLDMKDRERYRAGYPDARAIVDLAGARTTVLVPLVKDDTFIGYISIFRQEVQAFSDKQIALLQNFAAQAVIAMENARLLTETREALEQQTATAEVLQVINASPGNLTPVFDTILEKAHSLCDIAQGSLELYDGERFHAVAVRGLSDAFADMLRQGYPASDNPATRPLIEGERFSHIRDLAETDYSITRSSVELAAARTLLCVPLRRDDALLGMIASARREARPFSEKEIALLENFAAQAAIAMENARLLTEQREALEQQTATAEVLQVINSSPGELAPVFEAMLEKALRLCGADFGVLWTYDGERIHAAAQRGISPAFAEYLTRAPHPVGPDNAHGRLLRGDEVVHIIDIREDEAYRSGDPMRVTLVTLGGGRSLLAVPLRKDEKFLGDFVIYRIEVRPFSDKQIALLQSFAGQAVIAMENARLLTEQRETLEQQTATAEVLQVVNTSPGNLTSVFDVMLQKATDLCAAAFGILWTFDGEHYHAVAFRNVPSTYSEFLRDPPPATPLTPLGRIAAGEAFAQIADMADETFAAGGPMFHRAVELGGFRTIVGVPLRKDAVLLGAITIYRQEVRPFSDKQIVLLQNFAAQAVVAMENARLLDEIRQRQEELHITFENMGDGVAMFDENQHLVAWNRKFQDILDVPDDIIARRQTYSDYVRYLAERGEFGPDPEEQVRQFVEQAGRSRTYERTRPDRRVIEVRHNPVPDGGFVLIFSDITERKRNEAEIRAARDAAEEASRTIEAAYRDLKAAQANLIQAEKMASLGQLTAGIAHEIKNPLNFVNNFAALSVDLLSELKETAAPGFAALSDEQRADVEDVSAMLTSNLEKITEHGKRADGIVKAMLEHSRGSSGERRTVDLNVLVDEALNLAYHGARAQDQSFNITLERDFGDGIAPIEINPQDMTRVFLNIFSNGFYATTRRARNGGAAGFEPALRVATRTAGDAVEIRVRDNGTGIPIDIRDKLFQPFFTTKPTGEGTGLGLSITYDIVTQQHGGSITVDSKIGEYSEFQITLPRRMAANEGGRA